MRTVFLDAELGDRAAVLDHIAAHLEFPAVWGRNLDALWDALRTDTAGPFEIVWRDHDRARASLGTEFDFLTALFERLQGERRDFAFRLA